jgi:hypothetical protein
MKALRGLVVLAVSLTLLGGCGKSGPKTPEGKTGQASQDGPAAATDLSALPSGMKVLASQPVSATEPDIRDTLPDGAVVTFFYHGDRSAMSGTALVAMWNEPGVRDFFAPVGEALRTLVRDNAEPGQGQPDLLALEPLLRTQVAAAVYLPLPAPQAVGAGPGSEDHGRAPQPEFVIVVQAGREGSTVRSALIKGLRPLVSDEPTTEQNGVKLTPLMGGAMSYGFQGERFVAASKGMLAKAFDEKAAKVTASATWKALAAESDLGREVIGITLDVPQLLAAMPAPNTAEATKVLSAFGLAGIKGAVLTWAPRGQGMAATLYTATSTDFGLLAALKSGPVDEELMARCPMNAETVLAANVDPPKLYDGVMSVITQLATSRDLTEVHQAIGRAEATVGFKIRDELLASLDAGTLITFTEGGFLLPNITWIQKVKDEAKADEAMEKLLNVVSAEVDRQLSSGWRQWLGFSLGRSSGRGAAPGLMTTTHRGVKIKYANVLLATPAYAIRDGCLMLAVSPLELKDMLDRAPAAGSILDHPDFREVCSRLTTAAPQALYYGNSKGTLKRSYYLLPTLGSICSSVPQLKMKLDVGKLPSSDQIGRHLFGAAGSWQVTSGGIKLECYSPTGTPIPMLSPWMVNLISTPAMLLTQRGSAGYELHPQAHAPASVESDEQ